MPRKKADTKVVDAKHTITYEAPVSVPAEEMETIEETEALDDDQFEFVERAKRKPKNEREELRKKLQSNGVTSASPLKLIIERYLHSDGADSGTMAEKEYCTKYACNEAHITNQDYLDIANKWGPGRYWFTLYLNSKIVTQWERRLGTVTLPFPQSVAAPVTNGDPTSPQVIVMPGQQPPPIVPVDPMKQLKELLQMQKLMREALGTAEPQQAPQSEESLTERIMGHQKVIDTLVETVVSATKKAAGMNGGNGDGDDWPSAFRAVATEAIKSGQAPQLLQTAISALFSGFGSLMPNFNGGQNGTSQMAPQAVSVVHDQGFNSADRPAIHQQGSMGKTQQQGATSEAQLSEGVMRSQAEPPEVSAESQLLNYAIGACLQNWPIVPSAEWILAFERENPSVAPYVSLFISVTPADALSWLAQSVPNAQQAIQSAPHAETWVAQLQAALNAATEEEQSEEAANVEGA